MSERFNTPLEELETLQYAMSIWCIKTVIHIFVQLLKLGSAASLC